MLKNSYIHIPYVGYITERKIWSAGVKGVMFYKFKIEKFIYYFLLFLLIRIKGDYYAVSRN